LAELTPFATIAVQRKLLFCIHPAYHCLHLSIMRLTTLLFLSLMSWAVLLRLLQTTPGCCNAMEMSTDSEPDTHSAILLLGMVQMPSTKQLTLDSIIDKVSDGSWTPQQGQDMACIFFTRSRSGKQIFSMDLFGNGTCPLAHVCANWRLNSTTYSESILPQSLAFIDEIVIDYFCLTPTFLEARLDITLFEITLPFLARAVLPIGSRVFLPITNLTFDKIKYLFRFRFGVHFSL
jgi:hypothetical protein